MSEKRKRITPEVWESLSNFPGAFFALMSDPRITQEEAVEALEFTGPVVAACLEIGRTRQSSPLPSPPSTVTEQCPCEPDGCVSDCYRDENREKGVPRRIARTAIGHIKAALKEHLNTEWEIATYKIKADVGTICTIAENLGDLEADEVMRMRVNASGQCRKLP